MKKLISTLLFSVIAMVYNSTAVQAQCQAIFNVYQDTTLGAPLHHYVGNNNCQGANFLGIDTINYTYTWTWGDGTSTTAPFPSHTYATTGNYTICLYMHAVNPAGCNDTLCINATINKNAAMAYISIKNPYVVAGTTDLAVSPFTLHPNPASDKIFVNGLRNEKYAFTLFSVDGRRISNPILQQNQCIDIANLSKGNYFLRINSENNKSTILKFFKN